MPNYNFEKLINARHKVHKKRLAFLDKGDLYNSRKLESKINKLSDIIIDVIDNM